MFEYVSIQSCNKAYYEYRKNIYIFKSSYLAYFLHFGVQDLKTLLSFSSWNMIKDVVALNMRFL